MQALFDCSYIIIGMYIDVHTTYWGCTQIADIRNTKGQLLLLSPG